MNNPPQGAELSRLLSLAAHEVRNPLTTVVGFIRIALSRGELSPQHREWLQMAINSCGRLHEVGNQLSDYAKMVSGETKLNRAPTDLSTVLREAVDALPVFADRDVTVEIVSANGPTMVHGDSAWLKRAITSIVDGLRREVGSTNKLYIQQESGT